VTRKMSRFVGPSYTTWVRVKAQRPSDPLLQRPLGYFLRVLVCEVLEAAWVREEKVVEREYSLSDYCRTYSKISGLVSCCLSRYEGIRYPRDERKAGDAKRLG